MTVRQKIVTLSFVLFFCTFDRATPATWEVLESKKFQQWETSRNRNHTTDQYFCAAQTSSKDGTYFRLNFYLDTKDAFLEFFNPKWKFRSGVVTFTMKVDDKLGIELRGKSWGNGYTHDFLEVEKMQIIVGVLLSGRSLTLINSNATKIGSFSLAGVKDAVRAWNECQS